MNCTPQVITILIQQDRLSNPPWAPRRAVQQTERCNLLIYIDFSNLPQIYLAAFQTDWPPLGRKLLNDVATGEPCSKIPVPCSSPRLTLATKAQFTRKISSYSVRSPPAPTTPERIIFRLSAATQSTGQWNIHQRSPPMGAITERISARGQTQYTVQI
jgi:hypothetical protein